MRFARFRGRGFAAVFAALAALGCAQAPAASPQDQFFAQLSALCGRSFAGQVVSDDPRDAEMAGQRLIAHVRECGESEIRIPFHVGEDRSRTWIVTRTETGLRLKHDHRHEDGAPDALTNYGGDTVAEGGAARQEFPADAYSQALFVASDIPQSAANVWAIEVNPGESYVYELRREGRLFRVAFDLTAPVESPPPPWGAAD